MEISPGVLKNIHGEYHWNRGRPFGSLVGCNNVTDHYGKDVKTKPDGFFFFKTPCIEKEEQTTAVRGSAIWGNQNLPPQPPDMVPLWLLWIDQPRTCRCLVGRPLQSPQGLTLLQCYNGVGEYCNIKWRNQVEACLHYLFSLDHAYSECWMWPFNNQWIPTKKGAFSHFSLGFCIYNVSFVVMKTNDVEKKLKRALI